MTIEIYEFISEIESNISFDALEINENENNIYIELFDESDSSLLNELLDESFSSDQYILIKFNEYDYRIEFNDNIKY